MGIWCQLGSKEIHGIMPKDSLWNSQVLYVNIIL